MTIEAGTCFHCAAEIPAGIDVVEQRADATLRFCCHGCRGAYLLITGAGLDSFYRSRKWEDPAPPVSFSDRFEDPFLARFVHATPEGNAMDIIIDGIRCASCVWLNEKIIERLPGVLQARVNYATGRARVLFDPARITPAAIFSRIAEIGYRPRPYTATEAKRGADAEKRDLLIRFGTAFFLTMQLMAYSFALYAGYFQGIGSNMKLYLQLFSFAVTTPVIFYSGWPFLRGAWRGVVNGAPNMELLIAVGAISSYAYSIYATFAGGEVYFETAAMIVTLILAGRLLENAAKREAASGVEALLGLATGEARRLAGEQLETVDLALLVPGDLVLVAPGERFPTDGTVVAGSSDADESLATGEPAPVEKHPGATIIAGSTNLTGTLRVRCEKGAADSFVARVARLVEDAQSRRAPVQGLADRVAARFVPAVLLIALLTFAGYLVTGARFESALMTALAVVVIACPCALGLATPTAVLAGTGAAARFGVIFRGADVLERLSRVTVAIFDKTGTLTRGTPEVAQVLPVQILTEDELLALAAAVEGGSLHPVGKAICAHALRSGLPFAVAEPTTALPGSGVTGVVGGQAVAAGSYRYLSQLSVAGLPDEEELPIQGTAVLVAVANVYAGTIILKDQVRQDAPALVSYLAGQGIATALLSGDRTVTVRETAAHLGIETARGALSPADKRAEVERLRQEGAVVLAVGDGINDAPALSAADVGCAVAGGTDIAVESSELILVKPDLERLARAHRLARRTMTVVRQNLAWALVYNLVGIPLAMTGRLTPIYAAAAMTLSSLCVVGNSLRLGRR
ncbi:heavy metal translocating P-type ATPase [Geomesophilobacter sediminis]|uniref:Heavy metal translocating P-type ATPase n=1 Tax=Geomesophilobacter sediminis TaxID=2798584 RepID=A0A8J7JKR5_9BACT|nr:heavy metal translocating P-type ATPase [Geomesophilobacter sediminis]MBJ6724115.1 heavy metal translocating P-type ATPase [Geomesophilobacter sediminis]